MGPQSFYELHAAAASPGEIVEKIQQSKMAGVQWQNQILARAQLKHEVFLVSDLSPEKVRHMKIQPVSSVEDGITHALATLGNQAQIIVIPEGPRVIPVLDE
jgi:lactate racemase